MKIKAGCLQFSRHCNSETIVNDRMKFPKNFSRLSNEYESFESLFFRNSSVLVIMS